MPRNGVDRYNGKTKRQRLIEGEQMLADSLAGMRQSEMLVKYNVSRATLSRRLTQATAARIAPTVDEHRRRQNAFLDEQAARWTAQLEAVNAILVTPGIDIDKALTQRARALDGLLRTEERRARLNGTDAPVKVDATVRDVTPTIDSAVLALAEEIKTRSLT